MINPSHVGRTYSATTPYEISAAKVAEFALALKDDNPAYQGADAIAPPTFAAVIAAQAWEALFADDELDLALNRIIHGDQSFVFHRPLRDGDSVVAHMTIEKVRIRGAMDWLTVLVDLVVDGESVCESRSTLMHTREDANA